MLNLNKALKLVKNCALIQEKSGKYSKQARFAGPIKRNMVYFFIVIVTLLFLETH